MRKTITALALILCLAALPAGADGIGTLVQVGKSMADAKKTLDAEDQNFQGVKRALDSGALTKGQAKSTIRSYYGEPVVMNEDPLTGRERWVYKAADASFFEGPRIYLFFDQNGNLDEIITRD